MKLKFNPIQYFCLLGGGDLLSCFANYLKNKKKLLFVVTSERHLNERLILKQNIKFKDWVKAVKVKTIVTDDVNRDKRILNAVRNDPQVAGLSFGAAWIFKEEFVNHFQNRLFNVHGSVLPSNRGGGGFSWKILMGLREDGCTIHLVDEGIDSGPILKQRKFHYPDEVHTPREYKAFYVDQALILLRELVADLEAGGEFDLLLQDEAQGTYWPRLSTDLHGWIDWSWSAEQIERFICAFDDPYSGAKTFMDGKEVSLKSCRRIEMDFNFHPFQSGLIFRKSKEEILIAVSGNHAIGVKTVSNGSGENILSALRLGERFYTPLKNLEEALGTRVWYSPEGVKPRCHGEVKC